MKTEDKISLPQHLTKRYTIFGLSHILQNELMLIEDPKSINFIGVTNTN